MSKGSPIVPIRIAPELLATIDQAIARSAVTRRDEPWTRSSFIIAAIREKLAHAERSRVKKKRPTRPR